MSPSTIAVPDNLALGRSRKRDVVSVLGDQRLVIDTVHHYRKLVGFTMTYAGGVSCHLKVPWELARRSLSRSLRPYDEARGILSNVSFIPPFLGKTAKNIGLGDTLASAIKIYGAPEMREGWSIVENDQPGVSDLSDDVYACYQDGLRLHIPRIAGCRISDIGPYLRQPIVTVTFCLP